MIGRIKLLYIRMTIRIVINLSNYYIRKIYCNMVGRLCFIYLNVFIQRFVKGIFDNIKRMYSSLLKNFRNK